MSADSIQIGELYREHGVRGFCKVHIFSGSDENLNQKANYWLTQGDSVLKTKILDLSHVGRYFLVLFDCFKNPETIFPWRKAGLWLHKNDLHREPGQKFDFEWDGFSILHPDGQMVGQILNIVYTPKKNFSVQLISGETVLIPCEDNWIQKLDESKKQVVMDLPEGLWGQDWT